MDAGIDVSHADSAGGLDALVASDVVLSGDVVDVITDVPDELVTCTPGAFIARASSTDESLCNASGDGPSPGGSVSGSGTGGYGGNGGAAPTSGGAPTTVGSAVGGAGGAAGIVHINVRAGTSPILTGAVLSPIPVVGAVLTSP